MGAGFALKTRIPLEVGHFLHSPPRSRETVSWDPGSRRLEPKSSFHDRRPAIPNFGFGTQPPDW